VTEDDAKWLEFAIQEAETGLSEGGVPIGAALVVDGQLLATGRNRRVQDGSVIRHGETDCLENAGRLRAATYTRATMYTTLSPCDMCSGAILLYGIPRVVMGENSTFVGAEKTLTDRGVQLVNMHSDVCVDLMKQFISRYPEIWNEDIGE
jgi:cytosine/creatinine deaminase